MKYSIAILLIILFLPLCIGAQDAKTWQSVNLGDVDQSIANVDNLFIPLVNPSLLATGHASGLGWAQMFDNKKFRDHYWLFANLDGLSYSFENSRNPLGHRVSHHTLATGMELLPARILPNFYAGTNYRWENSHFNKGSFRTAVTYRPLASTSLAFRWDNPYQDVPAYHAGAAIRPLAWFPGMKDYRLELSGDIDYTKDAGEYGFREPMVGVNTQLVDGLKLGATYNLDTKTTFVTFSLSSGSTDLGTLAQFKTNDNYAVPYIHFTDDIFSPFMGIKGKSWYNMKLNGSVVTYKAPKYELGPIKIYDKGTQSVESIIADLKKAKSDPSIQGILLKNPSFATSLALEQELITAVQDFKSDGKKVSCYYDNISNGGYIFASSIADQIYLNPMGGIDLRGLSITSPYFRELLDTIGVDVLNFRSHKYKNAGNMFSEKEMTAAEREVYESLLQNFYDQLVASINANRGDKLKKSVSETIDAGPYFVAQDALDAGLVDGIIYEDQLDKQLKDDFGFSGKTSSVPVYRDYSWAQPKQNLIAVIYAQGNIVMGKGTPGTKIAQQTTVDLIRAARKNPEYKGIILRVDSGGGSAQASDIIWRELQLAKTENKKKIVVSMSGVAASGGYYISCGADKIIADPATITGSIGVIGLVFNLPKLYDKIHVNWSTVKKGANADFGSTSRAWTDEEKMRMESVIETTYEDFVGKVDAGRTNLNLDDVHALAQGRVWTGEQAFENGLIDDLGGMDKAVDYMRELTGIKGEIKLVDATTCDSGYTVEMSSDPLASIPQMEMINSLSGDYIKLYELYRDFGNDSALMLSPISAENLSF